jgi:hypothetical protein
MKRYILEDGTVVTTKLSAKEMVKRMDRLDALRVLTEGFTEGVGRGICEKALRAYNKLNGFTGVIRLTYTEKEFLDYMLEDDYLDDEEREVIKFYTKFED